MKSSRSAVCVWMGALPWWSVCTEWAGQGAPAAKGASRRGCESPSSLECLADCSYTGKAVLGTKPACLSWEDGLDDVPNHTILNYMLWPLGVFNVH